MEADQFSEEFHEKIEDAFWGLMLLFAVFDLHVEHRDEDGEVSTALGKFLVSFFNFWRDFHIG